MITIAVTIAHTGTDVENEAQLQALLSHVQTVYETVTWDTYDEAGEVTGQESAQVPHYEISNAQREHRVIFFQVVPYGKTKPASYDLFLNAEGCGGVLYGPEDAQRGANRFFNWGLKRGVDRGADIAIFLSDPASFTPLKLRNALADLKESSGLVERTWGRIVTKRALREIGQLREDRTLAQAMSDYKARLTAGGLE